MHAALCLVQYSGSYRSISQRVEKMIVRYAAFPTVFEIIISRSHDNSRMRLVFSLNIHYYSVYWVCVNWNLAIGYGGFGGYGGYGGYGGHQSGHGGHGGYGNPYISFGGKTFDNLYELQVTCCMFKFMSELEEEWSFSPFSH